jgi:hypothetical protein
MAKLTIPISLAQLLELVRQLSPDDRRAFIDSLLAERFDSAMSEADRQRPHRAEMSDEEIQAEVDAVRRARREERLRAAGG